MFMVALGEELYTFWLFHGSAPILKLTSMRCPSSLHGAGPPHLAFPVGFFDPVGAGPAFPLPHLRTSWLVLYCNASVYFTPCAFVHEAICSGCPRTFSQMAFVGYHKQFPRAFEGVYCLHSPFLKMFHV